MKAIGNLSIIFGRLLKESFFVQSQKADTEKNFVKRTIEYISEHFSEPITSSSVAESVFLNNSYFCRLFKKNFGCNFTEYLIRFRIDQTKILLNTTETSVSDIVLMCGFNSFSYFSKVFKNKIGISPSEYRKKKRKAV